MGSDADCGEADFIRRRKNHARRPRDRISNSESLLAAEDAGRHLLLRAGWEPVKLDPYDQRYYRTWMHELPPLRHHRRRTVIDVHHTILPESGRLRPDPADLLQAARPTGDGPFRVLAPTDMVLHSAAHLFQDGTLGMGLRDLTDLDALLRHFGETPGFWSALVRRAERLRSLLAEREWLLGDAACHIIPLVVGEPATAVELSARLRERGLLVPAIRPPSVPAGRSLLRISMTAAHTDELIARLVEALDALVPAAAGRTGS